MGLPGMDAESDSLKNVHSAIPSNELLEGIPEDVDIGGTGL